jgi:hypothetical protein
MQMSSRIDMKIDPETKQLAERAAAACGQSLSSYLLTLIRRDAPKVLFEQQQITLTNRQYDDFIRACETPAAEWTLSEKLAQAAAQLDEQGFTWR